ncbi:MAG: chemotaxis protein CheD [Magnetococcales bacterium]|nr:chemotaxis protein CheD [Magnetococcales bacterium]NGZ26604.1 chemotaxis protein CheD [Magnetococcales bacterium]
MNTSSLPVVWLEPGELFIGTRPAQVQTVLGSCVSVALFDRRQGIGAICHSRLASRACSQVICGMKVCRNLSDYVSCSLHFMLGYFDQHGSQRRELEVKLFGGANMFRQIQSEERAERGIGKQNVDTAMAIIRREKLHLVATDVGGVASRVITFNTASGEVFLKRGKGSEVDVDSN